MRQRSRGHGQAQHVKGMLTQMIMYSFFSFLVYPWGDQFEEYVLNQNRPSSLQIVQ